MSIECETCGAPTNCRIGMSDREEQPLRFCCQTCGSPIDIIISASRGGDMIGAKRLQPDLWPFDEKTNFVDLHLDFPVAFGKYVQGHTPFMMAIRRIGFEAMGLHGARLRRLDDQASKVRVFGLLLKLFRTEKWTPFRASCLRNFDTELRSDRPEDRAAAVYVIIANMMSPFAFPGQDEEASDHNGLIMKELAEKSPEALRAFMADIIGSGFLKKLQDACFEIYPRILGAELPLRPVLFLDFDEEFANSPIPMRISNEVFESFKDLYKDIAEIISRQFVLVAGVNNLLKRGDYNAFKAGIGLAKNGKDFTPRDLHAFAYVPFGKKLESIDDSWFKTLDGGADNKLRNAIAHFKTDYDEVKQVVTYYPRLEGMNQEKAEQVTFIQFMKRLLLSYREMRRLNHLIKGLLYLQYLIIDRGVLERNAAKAKGRRTRE
jgi:hypothetical protein